MRIQRNIFLAFCPESSKLKSKLYTISNVGAHSSEINLKSTEGYSSVLFSLIRSLRGYKSIGTRSESGLSGAFEHTDSNNGQKGLRNTVNCVVKNTKKYCMAN